MKQKQIIWNHKLNAANWMAQEETDTHLVIVYKFGKTVKKLDKKCKSMEGEKVRWHMYQN